MRLLIHEEAAQKNARKGSANGRSEGRAMRNENCRARLVREDLRKGPCSAAHAITRGARPPGSSKTEAVEEASCRQLRCTKRNRTFILGSRTTSRQRAERPVQADRERLCTPRRKRKGARRRRGAREAAPLRGGPQRSSHRRRARRRRRRSLRGQLRVEPRPSRVEAPTDDFAGE